MKRWERKQTGFTIVELLIVVVVIAILAAITIVAYNGIQQRARDAKRVDDVSKIVQALQLWNAETGGTFQSMSAGASGVEIGWFDYTYASYPSVKSFLVSSGYLNEAIVDPFSIKSGGDSYSYMITTCGSDESIRVVMARLENAPSQTVNEQIGNSCTLSYVDMYKMNYGRLIRL